MWQHEKEDCSDFGFLAHAFLDIGSDRFIDCRGVVDMKTIESEYVENEKLSYIITDKTGSIINEYINSEYFHPFEKNEENQLINFIYQNKEAYCFFKK